MKPACDMPCKILVINILLFYVIQVVIILHGIMAEFSRKRILSMPAPTNDQPFGRTKPPAKPMILQPSLF